MQIRLEKEILSDGSEAHNVIIEGDEGKVSFACVSNLAAAEFIKGVGDLADDYTVETLDEVWG